jgi:ABC-type branched-subunit amino acid transport system substrate-binding protein
MKNVILRFLVIIFALFAFSSTVWAERPIRILFIDPLSGPPKDIGERHLLGCQFAVEEINAQGGVLGRKVEVIGEDNQAKPDVAAAKAQKHLIGGNVDIVCVAMGAHLNKAVSEVTRQYNILHMNMTQSDEATGKDFSYHSISLFFNPSMMARGMVAAAKNKFRKFYLLNQDYVFGHSNSKAFKKEIERQIPGAQIVGDDFCPLWGKDLSPFLTKIKASGADVILTTNYGPDISILLKQRLELGVKATIINHSVIEPKVVRENPEAALGSITLGMFATTTTTKEAVDFTSRWKRRYKGDKYPEPDCVSAKTYMDTMFVLEGIKKAQSVKVDKLMPVLEGMHQKSLNGEMYLRACDHQLQTPIPVVTVVSTKPPYFSAPVMLPISATIIDEKDVENDRCRKR